MVGDVGLSEEADAGEGPHLGLHGRMETSASEGQVIVFSTFSPPCSLKNAMPSGL